MTTEQKVPAANQPKGVGHWTSIFGVPKSIEDYALLRTKVRNHHTDALLTIERSWLENGANQNREAVQKCYETANVTKSVMVDAIKRYGSNMTHVDMETLCNENEEFFNRIDEQTANMIASIETENKVINKYA